MAYEDLMTPFRQKLAAIKTQLPAGSTNAQNRAAIVALLELIDSMELNRIQTLLDGRTL